MSGVSSNTIIITTSTGRVTDSYGNMLKLNVIRPISSHSPTSGDDLGLQSSPRKRRRLTHLSTEDRVHRRFVLWTYFDLGSLVYDEVRDSKQAELAKQLLTFCDDEVTIIHNRRQRPPPPHCDCHNTTSRHTTATLNVSVTVSVSQR